MPNTPSYSFDQALDRRGMSSKWDYPPYGAQPGDNLVPMWIADMDFAVPPCVIEAIQRRLEHPTLGYFRLSDRFYDAIIGWQRARRGVTDVKREHILYQNSIVGGICAALSMLTEPGDPVLIHQPNYTGFTVALRDTGRRMVLSPLARDEAGVFCMDFEGMERLVAEQGIRCVIFCSPHNPTGRVWTRAELEAFSDFCERHRLKVISDEIWCDFVYGGSRHIATHQVSDYLRENTIAFYAPSKSFNLAGLRVGYSVTRGAELGEKFRAFCARDHYNVPNVLSAEALIGAYEGGASYVDALLAYIRANMEFVQGTLAERLPAVGCHLPEGTYTMWLDLRRTGRGDEENLKRMLARGLVPNASAEYNDTGFIRLNLACPRKQVERAVALLLEAMGETGQSA